MQKYRVIVTWEAVYDIVKIADYIEAQLGIARTDRFQEEIKEHLNKLETMGGIFAKTHLSYRGYSIYKHPFPPSIIFTLSENQKKKSMNSVITSEDENREWLLVTYISAFLIYIFRLSILI